MLKYRYGLSLFGSLLALALLGMMVTAAASFIETRSIEKRSRLAGHQLAVLTDASAAFVNGRFPALLTAARNGPTETTLARLRTEGVLPPGFPDVGALGRQWRILMRAPNTNALDVLVTEALPQGDSFIPAAALREATADTRLGLVFPDRATRLTGPTVDADISAFQADFNGLPATGALASLARYDHQSVFGNQLYRIRIDGFAEANRMETDLDMDGHAIANAGAVNADSLNVVNDFEAGGNLVVRAGLVVGRGLEVATTARITTSVTAASARVTGTASSDRIEANASVRAETVTASGRTTAGSIGTAGNVAAANARLGSLQSDNVSAGEITAANVTATSTNAELVTATTVNATEAGFSRLVVGRCTGC